MKNSLLLQLEWIQKYIERKGPVDVMNRQFVDDYLSTFDVGFIATPYGADRCPRLGRILSEGYKKGLFNRRVAGLWAHEWGFPNWVYVYQNAESRGGEDGNE